MIRECRDAQLGGGDEGRINRIRNRELLQASLRALQTDVGFRINKKNGEFKEIRMNKDQASGQWDQVKGRAKKAWGELTNDDFMKANGSVDKLHGIIQEKFGDSREAIKEKLDGRNEE